MPDQKDDARKKAGLISSGKIYISNTIKIPYPFDRSTTGPGAGSLSITLSFNNKNIKLEVSRDQNELFSLQKENNTYCILKGGKILLKNVKIIPTPFHAPGQAFINLESRCIYNCAFCNLSESKFLQNYDKDKFVDLIMKASKRNDFEGVALTSGIYPNNTITIKTMCEIIREVKEKEDEFPANGPWRPCHPGKRAGNWREKSPFQKNARARKWNEPSVLPIEKLALS